MTATLGLLDLLVLRLDPVQICIGVTLVLGLYMAWTIGANDVANSMADAVGSRACSIRRAILSAAICEFSGAVLVGSHVAETVRSGIVAPEEVVGRAGLAPGEGAALLALGMMSALLAAALWLHVATWLGMPVSTTHSIVGAVAGFGIVAAGFGAVQWGKMGQIVASWFISPLAGALISYALFRVISALILGSDRPARAAIRVAPYLVFLTFLVVVASTIFKGLSHVIKSGRLAWLKNDAVALGLSVAVGCAAAMVSRRWLRRQLVDVVRKSLAEQLERVEQVFAPLVLITSCTVAFAHGANDVANAVGPLAAVVEILRTGAIASRVAIPPWVLLLGGFGIVLGLSTYGYRVIATVGNKITTITPSRGVAADIAAMTTVLVCSRLGLPVSTTHTLVGAILGVALARGVGAINKEVTRNIFGSWLVTVPAAAGLAMVLFLLARLTLAASLARALIR